MYPGIKVYFNILLIGDFKQGKYLRFIKNFYTLTPAFVRELADQFLEFFKEHQFKKLLLHTDRAANQYSKAKEDFANKLKAAIEWQDNKATGWRVMLMSVGARNIEHEQEYNLAAEMFEGRNKNLSVILIDAYECKELKSSLEIAPMEKRNGRVHKVKKSEKLPLQRLPMESTNFYDAFKALICQPKYLRQIKGHIVVGSSPKVY